MTNPGAARVLVIDDDSQIRALTVEMLDAEGYQVDSAADGTAGLSIAYREPPDLILCDVHMGGVDGYEVLAALRRDPRTAIIPPDLLHWRRRRYRRPAWHEPRRRPLSRGAARSGTATGRAPQ